MTDESFQRVRIYLNDQDRLENRALYLIILERLQQEGASGATVLHGLAGFGPNHRNHPAGINASREQRPIIIEWIDRLEQVERVLPLLAELLPEALISREPMGIYQALIRGRTHFSDSRTIADVMRADAFVAEADMLLGPAMNRMLAVNQHTLPVVDTHRRLLGVIADQDLQRRAGVALPLRLLHLLDPAERSMVLAAAAGRPVTEIMNRELRTVYAGAAIPHAMPTMIEWNYRQIPVIERDGAFQGLLGIQEVLAASLSNETGNNEHIRNAAAPTPIHLIMQTSVPQVHTDQPLATALENMLRAQRGCIAVLDDQERLAGILDDETAIARLQGDERRAWLHVLQQPHIRQDLPGAGYRVGDFVQPPAVVLAPEEPINQATRHLLEHDLERIPVVDSDQRFLGIVARGALLRALEQEDE
jgi:CBS domain-containing protein